MPTDDNISNPSSPCPGPCDVAIPVVYPNQPIAIPSDEVARRVPGQIDVRASIEATFTEPDSSPPMSILRWDGVKAMVAGLGHAGIAMINGVTGEVRYFEYGRYDRPQYGRVREVEGLFAAVSFDEATGSPTMGSMRALANALTRTNAGPYAFEAVYIKLANGCLDLMKNFALTRLRDVEERAFPAYDVANNHCFTFAMEVAHAAGVRTRPVRSAPNLELRLEGGNFAIRGLVRMRAGTYEVPARQMRALQGAYQAFNASADGVIDSSFVFPSELNDR